MKHSSSISNSSSNFQYDSPDWGLGTIDLNQKTLSSRKLGFCLDDLNTVKGNILEVGCARGQFIRSIKKNRPDLKAYGCDINKLAIDLNAKYKDGVNYSYGDAYRLPYPDGFFNAVVIFDLMEHLEYPSKFIKEVRRVLKNDGFFHGFIPCEGEPWTLHWLLWKLKTGHNLKTKHRGHIQRFKINDVIMLFEDSGFKIKKKKLSHFWFAQILDILFYLSLEIKNLNTILWDVHDEKIIDNQNKSKLNHIIRSLRDFAFGIGYYEVNIFSGVPIAIGLHLSAIK